MKNVAQNSPLTAIQIRQRIEAPQESKTHCSAGVTMRYAWVSQRGYYPDGERPLFFFPSIVQFMYIIIFLFQLWTKRIKTHLPLFQVSEEIVRSMSCFLAFLTDMVVMGISVRAMFAIMSVLFFSCYCCCLLLSVTLFIDFLPASEHHHGVY